MFNHSSRLPTTFGDGQRQDAQDMSSSIFQELKIN